MSTSENQSSGGLFKKQSCGFIKRPDSKSGHSELTKRFDRLNKDGSDSVHPSQISQTPAAAGGLVMTTALKLAMSAENRLTVGCDMLTEFLRGGLLPGKLYEFYGESSTGKTQVAIQFLL